MALSSAENQGLSVPSVKGPMCPARSTWLVGGRSHQSRRYPCGHPEPEAACPSAPFPRQAAVPSLPEWRAGVGEPGHMQGPVFTSSRL